MIAKILAYLSLIYIFYVEISLNSWLFIFFGIFSGAQDGGLLATASGIFPEGGDAIVFFHVRSSH